MPGSQGKLPGIILEGRMVGRDVNGNCTNNSVIYRGRPYSVENMIDQKAIDFQREKAAFSWQKGFRTVAMVLTTGRIQPIN